MKFKIFLSSNRQEFHNERRLIKEAIENDIILNRFFKIFSFEEEPASGKTPQNRYSEAVLESDIYIGLLGSKYGTILESGISPTETEYNLFDDDENTYFFLKEVYKREDKTNEFIKLIREIKRSLSDFLDEKIQDQKDETLTRKSSKSHPSKTWTMRHTKCFSTSLKTNH